MTRTVIPDPRESVASIGTGRIPTRDDGDADRFSSPPRRISSLPASVHYLDARANPMSTAAVEDR